MKIKFTLLLSILINISCVGQCKPELENYAIGFNEIKASSFSFLDDALKETKIVGYGEDTHGTAEFTILAEELLKYVSQKHGFNVFIIETGFGEGHYLNDYIQGNVADLNALLEEHNSSWRYETKEFYQLLNGLKKYNETHTDKIHLYGCEMQYVIEDVNQIRAYLKKVASPYQITGFEKHLWQSIDEEEKVAYYNSYANLKKYFLENYESFKSKTSEKEFNRAFQHIVVLGQFVSAINQNVEQRKHDLRDIYMGENIQWILNFHGSESKAIYWAHNAHIGDWVSNGIVDVTGHQLRKMYGNSYFNIATDFGTGDFMAFSQDWNMETFSHDTILKNTFTECLSNLGQPNTFLNLRKARKDKKLTEYLNTEFTTMSGAGAQVRNRKTETNNLGSAFDAIIYVDKTSKINWIED